MLKEINGKSVILRVQKDSDAEFFAKWYSEPDVMVKCGFAKPSGVDEILESFHRTSDRCRMVYGYRQKRRNNRRNGIASHVAALEMHRFDDYYPRPFETG